MKYFPYLPLLLGVWASAVAPISTFAQEPLSETVTNDTAVTFSVDMSQAQGIDGTRFDPGFDGVWVNGDFAEWWFWGTGPIQYQLLDDGTGGDMVAGDLVYSLTLNFPAGSLRRLEYKYAIGSLDNESGFGDNHVRYIREDGEYRLPTDTFGVIVKETAEGGGSTDIGTLSIAKGTGGNVVLSWTGAAGVRVQKTSSLVTTAWGDVPGSTGASTVTVPASEVTGFFRLYRP